MKLVYSELFDSAWKSIKDDLALTAGLTLVMMLAMGVCSRVPSVGYLFSFPLSAGYLRCLLLIRKKEIMGFEDFFWGFANFNRWIHLVLLLFFLVFGAGIGLVLLIIPMFWWLVASAFSLQVMVLKDLDSVEAVKVSLSLVKGRWWNIFGFALCCSLILLAGFICFFIGIFVAVPVVALAVLIATEKLLASTPAPASIQSDVLSVDSTNVQS